MATTDGRIPAELLKLVERPKTDSKGRVVTETVKRKRGGETIEEERPVLRPVIEGEVVSWRIAGEDVVVVTVDGQKYSADVPEKLLEKLTQPAPAPPSTPAPPAGSGEQNSKQES